MVASIPPNYYNDPNGDLKDTLPSQANTYEYDFLGRKVSSNTPDSSTKKFIYDNLNVLHFYQDADGAKNGYINYLKYDNLKRTTEKGYYNYTWDESTTATITKLC